MVIMLCDCLKGHEYVYGEEVLGLRVETRVMYDVCFFGKLQFGTLRNERQGICRV